MITQKTIAARLGLSISLVSRVLSGKAQEIGIKPATIQRVLDEAARSNYTPNSAAQSLKGAKTNTLGVVTYDFEDPYFGVILGELHKIARENTFSLVLTGSYKRDVESLDLSAFVKHSIEGLIIVGSDRKKAWYDKFISKPMPTVQIGFTADKKGANICLDKVKSATLIADYLAKNACKAAALFLTHKFPHEVMRKEIAKALEGNKINTTLKLTRDSSYESINGAVKTIGTMPDFIVAGDDMVAIQVIRCLHELGKNVPADVKVIGFDNITVANNFIPALTTLSPPIKEMARLAFDLASTHAISHKTLKFAPKLIIRESA